MNRLRLRKRSTVPTPSATEVQVFADASGVLKAQASNGDISPIGDAAQAGPDVTDGDAAVVVAASVIEFPGATVTEPVAGTARVVPEAGPGGSQPDGEVPIAPVQLADCKYVLYSDYLGDVEQVPAYSYNNGVDGVGSTLTASANGVLVADGQNPGVGDRILVADAYNTTYGIFEVTDAGTDDPAGTPWVLTRTDDNDTIALFQERYWCVRITDGDAFGTPTNGYGFFRVTSLPVPGGPDFLPFGLAGALQSATATALGDFSLAIGRTSLALGRGCTAVATGDTAIGIDSRSDGGPGFALGERARALDTGAFILGTNSENSVSDTALLAAQGGNNVYLAAPDTTLWKLAVANDGTLTAVPV